MGDQDENVQKVDLWKDYFDPTGNFLKDQTQIIFDEDAQKLVIFTLNTFKQ